MSRRDNPCGSGREESTRIKRGAEMNRLQRENNKSIDKMSDQIIYYQDLTVIVNNRNTNQSIVREIRVNLLRLSILANPNMAAMYRSSKKNHYKIKKDNPKRPEE